jgi:hypothetical protein
VLLGSRPTVREKTLALLRRFASESENAGTRSSTLATTRIRGNSQIECSSAGRLSEALGK